MIPKLNVESMLKTVVLLNIFVETVIYKKHCQDFLNKKVQKNRTFLMNISTMETYNFLKKYVNSYWVKSTFWVETARLHKSRSVLQNVPVSPLLTMILWSF